MFNAEIISPSPARLPLKHWGGGLCALVPATSDGEASVGQLLLNHLPSADLLVLVDWCLPGLVDSHIGQCRA